MFQGNPIWNGDVLLDSPQSKVMIDPGHGDKFTGAKQIDPGAGSESPYEKDITLNIGKAVDKYLDEFGISADMTRTGDKTDAGKRIAWRIKAANDSYADIFVSIHADAAGPSATGFHVIYQDGNTNSEESKLLAKYIASSQKVMNIRGTGVDKDVRNLGVLREFKGRATVLVETGYITNTNDNIRLVTKADQIGKQIATGIYQFVNNGQPPIPKTTTAPQRRSGEFTLDAIQRIIFGGVKKN
jgi:N-acetylmuramoyl-L-alanine amidase